MPQEDPHTSVVVTASAKPPKLGILGARSSPNGSCSAMAGRGVGRLQWRKSGAGPRRVVTILGTHLTIEGVGRI